MWLLTSTVRDGSKASMFYDSEDIVGQLRQWLDDMQKVRTTKLPVGSGLAPLYINGAIKVGREARRRLVIFIGLDFCPHQVGKSTVLSSLLPAVIASHVEFGVGGASEVVILSLDLGNLPVQKVRLKSHMMWIR